MEARVATMCNLALTYDRWDGHEAQALDAYRRCAEDDDEGRFQEHALERSRALRETLATSGGTQTSGDPGSTEEPPPPREAPSSSIVVVSVPAQPEPLPPPRQRRPLLWTGLVVEILGLASLATAMGLHIWAEGVYDQLSEQYGDDPIPVGSAASDRIARGDRGVDAARALYIVGGVLVGAGVVLMLLDVALRRVASRGTRISFIPTVGPDGMALSGSVRF